MQDIIQIASEYPLAAVGVAFVVLMIFFFLFVKLVKIALILLLVLLLVGFAVGGYFYLQYPEERPANLSEAIEKARTGTSRALEKGKETVEKGREQLIDKGKEVYEKGKEVLEKGIDKGKDVVDKGKGAAGEIGKKIKGEKEPGTR